MSGWDEPVCFGEAKRPREITFLDKLPRTSVGKIRKFVIRAELRGKT